MESATLPRTVPLSGRSQVGLVASLLVLAAAGWALTGDRMRGMDAGPGTDLGGLGWFIGAWVVMMAAMMLPSITPVVLAHAGLEAANRDRSPVHPAAATAAFVIGYLLTWSAVGALGYLVVEGVRSLDLGFLAWDRAGPYVTGGVIGGAAAYQLTALKGLCLRQCRSPSMLVGHWHPGLAGAVRMGIEHGGFCVGCCWALMAALFALGVMSIGWMVVVAALIAAEKLLPWRAIANRGVGVVLAMLAIAVAFAPAEVPGLTIPGSPEAMESMGIEAEMGTMGGMGAMGGESMTPGAGSGP